MSGLFGSFGDAPGGLSEELREITTSLGLEYVYNDIFIARAGYFNESKFKGNRKYATFGFGLRYNSYGFDFAYLVATASKGNNALGGTLRFLVSYAIDVEKEPDSDSIKEN
ncbi:MAG TPA: PorV/PorQ family protein, partial [Cytophagales bacterium]|nr:PorV/PorQ family protein [Cytophagales bacterium]